MAQRKAVKSLQEEATCAICLDLFHQPVMLLACGHNFCRSCFTRCVEESHDGAASCPQCRLPFPPGGFCPNRQLANMVAVVRELLEGEQDLCRARGADLEHPVPLAEPLEDQARAEAERQQQQLVMLWGLRGRTDQRKSWLLARLGHLRRRLEEAKGRQGGGNRWDSGVTPSRSTEWRLQPLELEDFHQKNNALAVMVGRLKGTLARFLEEDPEGYRKVSVTLDPDTAHPQILVSPDGRSARRRATPRDLPPESSERFEALRCVLGRQSFTAGRHRWVVEVLPGPDWALGVARELVPRKRCFELNPAQGVWAVGQRSGQLRALSWPSPICLPLAQVPKRIEVTLNYGAGWVAFRDADSKAEIFAFPSMAFTGERLRPLLWLGEGPAVLTFGR